MRRAVVAVAVLALAACGTTPPGSAASAGSSSTPATASSAASHTGPVLVVGDSLSVGAAAQGLGERLRADGWTPEIDAVESRAPQAGIDALLRRSSVPPLVVVELGTNPSSAPGTFASDVTTLVAVAAARGATRIVWVTPVHRDDDRYDDKDRMVAEAAAGDPRLVVADWPSIARLHREWFRADGLHYTDEGYRRLAAFMADAADANAS